MMRVAVLSDVHGNLLALEAVLADLAAAGDADTVVVAGDLCLGGPQPRETLARLRALGYPLVQGNTDRDLALAPAETAASDDADLLDWTREQLGAEGLDFLGALPFDHRVADPTGARSLRVVHANPQNLDDHLQPYSPDAKVAPLLADLAPDVRVLAFGHLHIPFVREFGTVTLANIASVGQPKDGDRRANYGLLRWDDDGWSIEQRRVEYPVDEVVARLREVDPPGGDELIKTLLRARYPNLTVARGGRPPKRRAPARPPAIHTPQDSEALVTAIGTDAGTAPAAREANERVAEPATVDVQIGEPIATGVWGAEGGAAGDATPPESRAAAGAAPADDPAADAVVTPDAELAETPILPPAVPDPIVEAAPPATNETDGPRDPRGDAIIAEDADLASAEDEVAADDQPGDDGSLAATAATAATPGAPKGEKKRRKRARKAAKEAAQADAPALSPDDSFADALPALLESRLGIVLAHLEGVRADDDPEAVHDMRVATRRLRAALVPAERFYGPKTYRKLARPVRDLARALGRVRDADVLLAYLRERRKAVASEEQAGIEGLIDLIAADRATARDDLDPVLDRWEEDGDRAATFVRLAARAKARGKAKGHALVGAVAAQALDRDVALFAERAELLTDEGGSAEAFHELRIAGKKLRYTLELFAPIFGPATGDLLGSLKALQETLGEIHDRDVLADLLAWERARALERQLHNLEFATFNPGTREERLRATRRLLDAPDSFAATAIGAYGLLIDATSERDALEERLRATWGPEAIAQFVADLARLSGARLAEDDDPEVDEPDDAASEAQVALAEAN